MTAPARFSFASAAPWRTLAIALAVVALAYLVVFAATRTTHPGWLAVLVFGNTASLALAAAAVRAPLLRWTPRLGGAALWATHGALALIFSWGWLWLLTLLAGLMGGDGPMRFQVSPLLFGPAQTWQLLQGIAVYVALAAWTALELRPPAAGLLLIDDRAGLHPERLLLRDGDGAQPLAAGDIVSITGADDYAEILTAEGTTRLVATRLAEFEAALDPKRFVRVHRSAIINLDRLVRADGSGGGRMLLHMAAGPPIAASRVGAKALRERLL